MGKKSVAAVQKRLGRKEWVNDVKRVVMVVAASVIMAANLKSFVRTGGLIPGGFNGLTRLLQEICVMVWEVDCLLYTSRCV